MTGARVNAPLVAEIILDMIKIMNIPKNNNELLKADTKSNYRVFNASIDLNKIIRVNKTYNFKKNKIFFNYF